MRVSPAARRFQTAAFLLLLFAAQVFASLHGVSHIYGPDDQACSQCRQGQAAVLESGTGGRAGTAGFSLAC
ncbi:MAG: hypothetical protein HYR49_07600 [Gammaproteobacteria bacterium]|nr:hypothetical protein [Gammaproteobacteria bacterium]